MGIPNSELPAVEHLFEAFYPMYLVHGGISSLCYLFDDPEPHDNTNFFHDT